MRTQTGDDAAEILVPVPGGDLAVLDHGGSGRDIILVHSLGYNAAGWGALARPLTARARVVAIDRRGHGHSTAPMTRADDLSDDLPRLVDALGLDAPVILGHDTAHYQVSIAAIRRPELVRGVVLLAGLATRTRGEISDAIEETTSTFLGRVLRDRFLLGASGHGPAAREAFITELTSRMSRDWLTSDLGPDLTRALAERSTPVASDGSWQLHPTLGTLHRGYAVDLDPNLYPCRDLFAGLRVPSLAVHPLQGLDSDHTDDIRALCDSHPLLSLVSVSAGQWPQATCPTRLADILAAFLDSLH